MSTAEFVGAKASGRGCQWQGAEAVACRSAMINMRKFLVAFIALFLLCVTAQATTYTVKAGGGGNFTTIQACANAAVNPGDTCAVYAGTYNEAVTLSHSGTGSSGVCTACITFQVNPGDTVQVYGFRVLASYVVINGFLITDPALSHARAGVDIDGSWTGVQVLNNTITQVGADPCVMSHGSTPASFITISGNTISWCGAVPGQPNAGVRTGIEIAGDHFLVQNNVISHTINGMSGDEDHSMIRGNTWGPVNDAADFPGCHETSGCDTHADFVELIQSSNTRGYVVIEGNIENNILGVGGAHAWIGNPASGSVHVISRFNTEYSVGSGYLANNGGTTNISYWKDYNNTLISNQTQGVGGGNGTGVWVGAPNGAFLNNLMYNDVNPSGAQVAYYSVDGTSSTGFVSGHNLAFDTGCVAGTKSSCTNGLFSTDAGNVYGDPKLVNPTTDFHLQPSSPAIGAGGPLTAANGSGSSSTALTVNDAGFFQDGYGIAGVQPDWIRVGASTTVRVSSINYATNVITLATAISWNNSDPVYLYKDSKGNLVLGGVLPNIGADQGPVGPPPTPPTPPTNPAAVPH